MSGTSNTSANFSHDLSADRYVNGQSLPDLRTVASEFFGWAEEELRQCVGIDGLQGRRNTRGELNLRDALSGLLGERASSLVITDGASQGLLISLATLLKPREIVLVPQPWFPGFASLPRLLGARLAFYDASCEERALERMQTAVQGGIRAIVVQSPRNPDGHHYTEQFRSKLMEMAGDASATFIWDCAYYWTIDSGALTGPGCRVYSLAKALGVPNLRLGVVSVDDKEVLNRIIEIKRHLSLHTCPLSEDFGFGLIDHFDILAMQRSWRERLSQRREDLLSARSKGLIKFHSQELVGPYFLMKRGPELLDRFLGVPGDIFGADSDLIRVCLAASAHDWQDFMRATFQHEPVYSTANLWGSADFQAADKGMKKEQN